MKFGKAWKQGYDALPTSMRGYCIDYKRWKKLEDVPGAKLMSMLEKDVTLVESKLSSWNRTRMRHEFMNCFCGGSEKESETVSDMLAFIELNAIATRKVCKRLNKRLHVPATTWFVDNSWRFAYCSKAQHEMLRIISNGCLESCPICFEMIYQNEEGSIVVTSCGHAFCSSCIRRMAGVETARGTLHNVLSWARHHGHAFNCPMCRRIDPTKKMLIL